MKRKPLLLLLGFGLFLTGRLLLPAGDIKEAVAVTFIVVDSSGAGIPHAQIKLTPQPATTPKNPETNENGEISLNLIPGRYSLFVAAPLFLARAQDIEVEPNADQTVRIIMQIASATTIVKVCSPCLPIQTSPIPEPPIGLLPLPPSRPFLFMQLAPPSLRHRSASTRRRAPAVP